MQETIDNLHLDDEDSQLILDPRPLVTPGTKCAEEDAKAMPPPPETPKKKKAVNHAAEPDWGKRLKPAPATAIDLNFTPPLASSPESAPGSSSAFIGLMKDEARKRGVNWDEIADIITTTSSTRASDDEAVFEEAF
eukprot:2039259-Alexandrium_andersonii.AAC.1